MGFFKQSLQLVLQPRVIARQLVLCAHHCAPEPLFSIGHKAQGQLLSHQPLHQPFGASRKSFLRPRRPRLDSACARCSAPDIGPAFSRFLHVGFQYRSSSPQTGFQYCAVDSSTTSSTCCSISHSDSSRRCSGLLPYQRRSNWYSSSTSTSATATANFFLCTSIPAIL